jgi:hypothetical protein
MDTIMGFKSKQKKKVTVPPVTDEPNADERFAEAMRKDLTYKEQLLGGLKVLPADCGPDSASQQPDPLAQSASVETPAEETPEPEPWVDPLVLRAQSETHERDKAIRNYLDRLNLKGTERSHLKDVLLNAWHAGQQQILDRYPPDFPTTR